MVEILFLVFLSIVPGLCWLALFLHEDWRHPESRFLIFYTFLGGMVVTTLTLFIQNKVHEYLFQGDIITLLFSGQLSFSQVNFLIVFSAIEEIAKFLVVWLLIRPLKDFNEPIDAMIYMIVAALGFAVVENIAYVSAFVKGTISVGDPTQILLLRATGSTLLHALTSGVLGYYWALEMFQKRVKRFIPEGLAVAILLHVVFNYLIIVTGAQFITPLLFLAVVLFFLLIDFQKIKHKEHLI